MIDSDHAVPYLMTRTPWRLYDFYYWRAVRFGSVYVTFWKAIGAPLFGAAAAPFYFGHALLFFLGLALWLMALRHPTSRALFLWICLPLTSVLAYHFLFPGQLYGMLFFLMGAFFLLLERKPDAWIAIGAIAGIAYWQHELAGALCLAVAVGASRPWRGRREARSLAWLLLGFLPAVCFAELARRWAGRLPVDKHYVLEPMRGFWHNLVDFSHRGLPFFGGEQQGFLLLASLVLVGWLALKNARRSIERLDAVGATFFVAALACIALINLSHHYVENDRADRYYAFLVPATIFLLLRRAEETPRANHRRIYLFLVAFGIAATSHVNPRAWTTSAPLRGAREARVTLMTSTLDSLRAAGCPNFLGTYWEAYALAPIADGALDVSAWDHVRNFEIFDRIRNAPRFCASASLRPELREGKIYGATCAGAGALLDCRR